MVGGKGAPDTDGIDRKDQLKGFKELHFFWNWQMLAMPYSGPRWSFAVSLRSGL